MMLRASLITLPALAAVLILAHEGSETTLRLTVPKSVAAHAARRMAGEVTAPPPILILEGVELGEGEGITIRVLGPPESVQRSRRTLAVAGMVGAPQKAPKARLTKTTLAIPLNDEAAELLQGRSEITLTFQVNNSPGRPSLKIDRAYFQETEG